jgi:hypothetical protein
MDTERLSKASVHPAIKRTCVVLLTLVLASSGFAEIKIVPLKVGSLFAFPGADAIEVVVSNSGSALFTDDIQTRVYQGSSATMMPIAPAKTWKKIEVAPGKRLIESVGVDYPSVTSATTFQVQFLDGAKKVVGKVGVQVLPADVLKQLSTLNGNKPVGIYDPENQLKPVLSRLHVDFDDLQNDPAFDAFHGKFLIAGPFSSLDKVNESLRARVSAKLKQSCSVVWLLPPQLQAPFGSVCLSEENASEVVLHDVAFKELAHSASAQFNLLRSVHFALDPQKLSLSRNRPTPK